MISWMELQSRQSVVWAVLHYIFSLPLQKLRQTWIKQDIANISLNSDDDRCFVKGEQDQDTD